jgi:hypothetical protein
MEQNGHEFRQISQNIWPFLDPRTKRTTKTASFIQNRIARIAVTDNLQPRAIYKPMAIVPQRTKTAARSITQSTRHPADQGCQPGLCRSFTT